MDQNLDVSLKNQPSNDDIFVKSLKYWNSLLNELDIDHYLLGSTSMQAYCMHVKRIPNDIDITLNIEDINKLQKYCARITGLTFTVHPIASKIHYDNKYYLHLIPKKMKNYDKVLRKIVGETQVFFFEEICSKELFFLSNNESVNVKVPSFESVFCYNLFSPIDSNIISDVSSVLESNIIDMKKFENVFRQIGIMKNPVANRLDDLHKIYANCNLRDQSEIIKELMITIDKK